ncbi:MAG: multiple antibiotic resistance protein [Desulfuromonadales bacterium]|jgi:multiple antibiotic resistance protein|nr:multiple antibiotic resistance protein [Desulfuromonadales bacterium]
MFLNIYLKLFVILTPFFVMSAFLSLTRGFPFAERQKAALKVTVAIVLSVFVLYLFGRHIFALFGITLDAFRIGAGAVLFLSAVNMVRGPTAVAPPSPGEDVAVVPLAIPIAVGPGTIGALLVMAAEPKSLAERLVTAGAMLAAIATVGLLLSMAGRLERLVGQQGLTILTKLTGLFVSAIAAQIFFTGLKNFLA